MQGGKAMQSAKLLAAVILCAGLTACATVSVTTDYDPEADFSTLQNYAWDDHQQSPDDALAKNPLIRKRVKLAIDNALRDKGFNLVSPGKADFVVVTHAGVKERMQVTNWGRYGWYDPWWGPYGGQVDVSYYQYGTLVIDMVDHVEKDLIWRGLGKGIVREARSAEQSQKYIDETVSKILADFPPGAKEN
jgi:hypothetical protein